MNEIKTLDTPKRTLSKSAYGYYGGPPSDAGNFDWREYYFAVKERLWLVILCIIFMTIWGFYQASSQIFVYRANSVLEIQQGRSRVLDTKLESVTDDQVKSMDMINTLIDMIGSYQFALRVVNHLQLAQDNSFLMMSGFFGRQPSPESIAGTVSGMVTVAYRGGTDLIDISVTSRNSDVSVKLANAYAEEYLRYVEDQKRDATRQASAFLVEEAERLRKKMRASDEGMQSFRERERAASIETMLSEAQGQITECASRQHSLASQLTQVNTDLEAARADTSDIHALLALPSITSDPQVATLADQIQGLENQFSLVKLRYRAKHPAYLAIKTQIDLANVELSKLLKNVVPLLETKRDNLIALQAAAQRDRENAEKRLLEVTSKSIEYNDLKRELESDSALYEAVVSRIKEVDITKELSDSSFRIHQLAGGSSAVGKAPFSILMKNFMSGIALGLGLVIALHKLDSSFKTVDQAERATKLNVLAGIPQIGGASASILGFLSREQTRELFISLKQSFVILFRSSLSMAERLGQCHDLLAPTLSWLGNPHRGINLPPESELVVRDDRRGIVAETFRSLRASVAMNPSVEHQRVFLFTSAVPGEGKSFCSSNFSISLAQQGLKTLLIDADLRKPVISRIFFGMRRKPGLAEILQDTSNLDAALNVTSIEGLSILTAGGRSTNPSEILAGQKFRDLVVEALTKFDRIVIDSAPVLAVSDTLLIAIQSDILCLVVRSFVTPRRMVKRALKALEEINKIPSGIVLNCLPYGKGAYYYYTSGKYYGDYGKNAYSPRTSIS